MGHYLKGSIHLILPALLLFIVSCTSERGENQTIEVKHAGALKNFMHKGDISAKVDLRDLEITENLYALGALESLKGEIMILNSQPLISRVKNDKVEITDSFQNKAALLVYATVKDWKSHELPSLSDQKELEEFIAKTANEAGMDMGKPFPFILEGKPESLRWHVIDWPEGDTVHTHKKHIESGLNGTLIKPQVEILGFYSNKHHAVFTHHTTNMHLHFKTDDGKLAGHIDGINPGGDLNLKLPMQ